MIELTETQQEAIALLKGGPPKVVNPTTDETYVLLPVEEYEKLKALLVAENQRFAEEMGPLMGQVLAEDWKDADLDALGQKSRKQ